MYHALQLQHGAWPISVHAHWHNAHVVCAEGLHFSAFHSVSYNDGAAPKSVSCARYLIFY